jgi:hypothetical protein
MHARSPLHPIALALAAATLAACSGMPGRPTAPYDLAALLEDRAGRRVGRCCGPPATWKSDDGSKLTATQVAVAMAGVSDVQRVATRGGTATSAACDAANRGRRETVRYQTDYIFHRAG